MYFRSGLRIRHNPRDGGRWVFDPTYSQNPASPSGTGETIATMLLGYPIAIRRDVFLGKTGTLRTNELNFFVRDECCLMVKMCCRN
jgi:hypothetical protein